ncbi:DUF5686 and carboxypeptidase-like regulatory domain-containing protein [Mucilaginibacter ginsenosidivorans]|uniref:Carboxypeptidase-like regulatory domain-containing protein n=1 Tax=Mucilaginibacter ginsenosidivorans TaxID=398053 RepID=A0A5B8V0A3_9SPHI|nr:DUF5686 and carboxypeptidase-like regulatory domain-containing protein [Mucilaginibacter ginsenosidivorans]QEC64051.1 carboxypeptidase-like regulatory domain-containing protein [Mucilaginibacter ginsenosidivorans]
MNEHTSINFKSIFRAFTILTATFLLPLTAFSQVTKVSGVVSDARSKETLPFATISVVNTKIVGISDENGKYAILDTKPFSLIKATCVGYIPALVKVEPGQTQLMNIKLQPRADELNTVVIRAGKKERYRNKNNPAVELIRQVIAHKDQNRPENYDYVQYKEYGKLLLAFANVSPGFSDKKFWKKYKFLFDNRDTTLVPGKSLTPVYLDEKLTQNYYRQQPGKKKTITLAQKNVKLGFYIDNEGLAKYFRHLFYDVDIYKNDIYLLSKLFLSPIANSSPSFYKFFITDTVIVNNTKVVELSFTPRNNNDLLFDGKIYITLDGNYAVQKSILYINKNTNINFVKDMRIDLDFEQNTDKRYHVSKSNILVDFSLNRNGKGGMIGSRTTTFKDYQVNQALPDSTYSGLGEVVNPGANNRDDEYWAQNRLDTLTHAEAKVYHNIDTLQSLKSFRRTMAVITWIIAGYNTVGPFEIGPANAFYSFNNIEGARLRFGGRTTPEMSKRYYFETYGAYGFKDQRWKYFLSGTYSFDNKYIYQFPQNYVRAYYENDAGIPGNPLQFVVENNLFLSFKRGNNDKYLYNKFFRFDYVREFENHFSYNLGFRNLTQSPAGSLYFTNLVSGVPNTINQLTSTEIILGLRYAPHEEFYQGRIYRIPVPNKYPAVSVDYTRGVKGVFGGGFGYQILHGRVDKHLYLSQLGYADVTVQASHTFGQLPYPLLTIHRANQTYSYDDDPDTYNLMNFLEFVSDHYESLSYEQHLNGFFLNKIPLFKRLKWRETLSFKALFGGVTDQNNPSLHPSLYQFPVDGAGRPLTYSLGKAPYLEGSVGIENIFKFFGVSLVRRFNYLDHPDAIKYGFRTSATILF